MNMISRIWSVLTSFSAKSNSSSIPSDRNFSSRKRGRIEPLEERNLLAATVSTLFPAPENEVSAPALYATETPTEAPTIQFDLNEAFSNAELEDDDYTITPVSDASADEGEEDALVPDFVRDGIAYYSATKLIARQVVFDLGDVNPNDDLADGDPIFLGENSGEVSNLGAGDSPRSGGGDPTPYPLVVQTTCSSSLVNICTDKVNPLQESRCGTSSDPLTNSDYVTVTLPTLPFGYRAEVSFSPSAFQYCTAYVPDGADFNSVTSFQYSGGATVYLVPNNNSAPESDRVVTLTLNTPCPLESGGGTCVFDEICMTATATIIDDDQWVVTVEATDDKATERLPGVEADYGEYAFTRTHDREGIPGDTSYAINLEFKTLQTPDFWNSNYQAQYLLDYTLSTTPLAGEQSSEYLSGFTYVGSVQSYDLDDEVAVTYYQFQGAIPENETSSKLRLAASYDLFDEGDQTLADDEDPSLQQDEIVCLELTRAYWSGLDSNANRAGDPSEAEVEIKDGAILHIGFEDGPDRFKNIEGDTGYMAPNIDDDNENGIEDRYETGVDDDVRRVFPRVYFENLNLINGYHYAVSVLFSATGSALAGWTNPARTVAFDPFTGGLLSPLDILTPGDANFFDPLFWDGIGFGIVDFFLEIYITVRNENNEVVETPSLGTTQTAGVKVTNLRTDIDIDSMNRGLGANASPLRSEEEESFEDHRYALGKVMLPYDAVSNAALYEIVLEIPEDVDLNNATMSLNYSMANRSLAKGNLSVGSSGSSQGHIVIWNSSSVECAAAFSVNDGGNLVVNGYGYAPDKLGFNASTRTVSLYVEAVNPMELRTRDNISKKGKEDIRIEFSITVGNETASDSVRYVVTQNNDYYYKMTTYQQLVSAHASQLVYDGIGNEKLCLKALSYREICEFGLSDVSIAIQEGDSTSVSYTLAEILSGSRPYNIKANLYREYITGKYVITFGGTTWYSATDWINNYQQWKGQSAIYYKIARLMGESLSAYFENGNRKFEREDLYVTGHSLGGGLASCLSVVANMKAYTFNAAGLEENSIRPVNPTTGAFINPIDLEGDELQAYYDLITRYNSPGLLIEAYYVDFDPLTYLQQNLSSWQEACGTSIRLRSEYNDTGKTVTEWTDIRYYMCHKIEVVIDCLINAILNVWQN